MINVAIPNSASVSGEHPTTADRDLNELTATMQDLQTTPNVSHALPHRRGRRSNAATPIHFNHVYEGPDNFDTEEERDTGNKDVLTFHGLILRSQLTELFKNKIFFNESEGVSHKSFIIQMNAFCVKFLQPESQRKMSYSTLMNDYPRYPTVADYPPAESERDMLMVCFNQMVMCVMCLYNLLF